MIRLKNYFLIALFTSSVVPMHAMQQGLGYLRGKAYETFEIDKDLQPHYATLGLNCGATEQEVRNAFRRLSLTRHPDKHGGSEEPMKALNNAKDIIDARAPHQSHVFFDLYIAGGLIVGTAATVAGLIKTWRLYKEYSSSNSILLEKMELAANKAVAVTLNLAFDRYNPTQDTDALSLQFELDPLLAQLSSDNVRDQVKQAILEFDKTLEATYEQCAWHYDGMTLEDLLKQNPRLVDAMLTKLQVLLQALNLCKTDLQLDRNKPLEFFKAHCKKMIGAGLVGSLSWYAFKKLIPTQNAPQAQPVIHSLCGG